MAKRARAIHVEREQDPLLSEITDIVRDADAWLDTPNSRLGGQPPRALLGSPKGRSVLHGLVQAVKHGMVT